MPHGYVKGLLSDSDFDKYGKDLDPKLYRKAVNRVIPDGKVLFLSFYELPLWLDLESLLLELGLSDVKL